MKSWFLVPLFSATLLGSACADDLNARAVAIKSQLQVSWLPGWAAKSPANESATDAASLLETLSRAHRLGYSTPQLNLLDAARVHYRLLRDSRRDKTSDGFFNFAGENQKFKVTQLQAQVVSALVEYARASGEGEPRGLATKTWRLIRDRGRDKVNGGYFDGFLSGPLAPTQASGGGNKTALTHLALLQAGTALTEFTRDRSIKVDLAELLDLNEGRFFPARVEEGVSAYTGDWKKWTSVAVSLMKPKRSQVIEAGTAIAHAQTELNVPVQWVDFARRADELSRKNNKIFVVKSFTFNDDDEALHRISDDIYLGGALEALTLLARNISRERRSAQIDEVLDTLNNQTPDVHAGAALLDFVAAFSNSSGG